jgi:hypothetical protein
MSFTIPKKTIYSLLQGAEVPVYQARPEVIKEFPCITFQMTDNNVTMDLDKEIGYQNAEVTIDIWTAASSEGGELLATVEGILRAEGYQLTLSLDVPDPEGISHIRSVFKFLI